MFSRLWSFSRHRSSRRYPIRHVMKMTTSNDPLKDLEKKQDEIIETKEALMMIPLDFNKASKIEGHESQIVHIDLKPNQQIRAETGAMLYMTHGIEIETTSAGGIGSGLKRMMTGENFFVSNFTYHGEEKGTVAFGTSFPSKIVRVSLADYGGSLICQQGAFLCGSSTINIEMEFTKKLTTGFFGGEGFILQKLTGEGDAFIRAGGALIERELAPGEELRISTGCLVAFEPTVAYDITTMPGFKNVVFGGEGLFITTLTGPGKVFLQGLPMERVVDQIARRIPSGGGGMGMGIPMAMGGLGGGGTGDAAGGAAAGAAGEVAAGAGVPKKDSSSSFGNSDESSFGDNASSSPFGDTSSSSEFNDEMPESTPDPFDSSSSEDVWTDQTGTDSSPSGDEDGGGAMDTVKDLFKSFFD